MKTALPILVLMLLAADVLAEGRVPVRIVGNEGIDTEDLEEAAKRSLQRYVRNPDDEAFAEDAAFDMLQLYHQEGYPVCEVEAVFPEGREGVEIRIVEGPRVFVGEISVGGARVIDAEALAEIPDPPKTWLLGSRLVVHRSFEEARQKMKAAYLQIGYSQVVVQGPIYIPPLSEIDPETCADELEVDVRYLVTEGPPAHLAWVNVICRRAGIANGVRRRVEQLIGQPYGPYTPHDLQMIATDYCSLIGHPFSKVDVTEEAEATADGTAFGLTLTVRPGPKTTVRRVLITGNTRTQDDTVRREIELYPGDPLETGPRRESRKNLFRTGLFRQVFLRIVPPERDPEAGDIAEESGTAEADVEVRLKENDTLRREFSIGWGAWEFLRGSVAMTWANLGGTGRSVRAELGGSFRGWRASLRGTDPWLLGYRLKGVAEAAVEQSERPNYTSLTQSIGLRTSREVGHDLHGYLGYAFRTTDVTHVSGTLPDTLKNTTTTSAFILGLIRESRDPNPVLPVEGSAISGSVELGTKLIGGDLEFLRYRAQATQLFRISGDDLILVTRAAFGIIQPIWDTDTIPIQERFFLGGSQTVRSFRQDDLGPDVGGEFFSLANAELRIRIAGALEGAVFGDGGNVLFDHRDASFRDYRFGVGAGARFRTPIGPLRLDFAVNPDPRPDEDRWQVFFAVGYPF